jgi:hypothetical protein
MSKAYNAIVDTTPTTIRYSILFTSYLFSAKDVTSCSLARRGVTQLGNAIRTGMTPSVASTTMLSRVQVQIVPRSY